MPGETALTRTWNDIVSHTRDRISPLMADNVSSRIPYLVMLNAMDRKELWDGGNQIHFNIFKDLGVAEGYTDMDVVQTTRTQHATRAIYEWKQLQSPVTISGREMAQNSGEAAIKNLLKSRIEAAVISLANTIGGATSGLFSNNTESTLTSLTGLQALVSFTPTSGTVGNISRANSFWQNQADAVSTNWSTDGLSSMRNLWLLCSHGSDVPDLIVFNRSYFSNYETSLQATLSYNLPSANQQWVLDLGIPNVMNFKGAPMIYDDGVPANRGYFVNSKYLRFIVHKDRDFELGEFVVNSDLDALMSHIWFMGEQCVDGMRYQGLLSGGDTYS